MNIDLKNSLIDKAFVFVLIILAVVVIVSMLKNDSSAVSKLVEKQNKQLETRIDSLESFINKNFKSIRLIDSSRTIYKNYYETKQIKIDELQSDSAFVAFIRDQLLRIGAARFD